MQETGLGTSAVYDPQTGTSRVAGNHGHGLWQLDPASGASAQDLARAAKDPSFAADRAAQMLSGYLKQHGGNTRAALDAYNGGGSGYADGVLSYLPRNRRGALDLLGDTVPALPKGAVPIGNPPLPKAALPALPKGAVAIARPTPQPQNSPAPQPTSAPTPGSAPLPKGAVPIPHGQPSFVDRARNAVTPPLMHAAHVVADVVDKPLGLLNAVLGAPQRFIAGGMQADQQHHKPQFGSSEGTYRNPFDQLGGEVRGGLYGVLHPNDSTVQDDSEKALGTAKLKVPNAKKLTDKLNNFGVDLLHQTATDPLTFVTGPTRALGDAAVQGFRRAGTAALRSGKPVLENFAGTFIPHAGVQAAFTPRGKAAVVGIRNSEDYKAQQIAHDDAALLKKHKTEIAQGNVPDEVRQRLLREPYVYGTRKMRQQALAQGYKPTAEEVGANGGQPYGILHHNVKADYFPHVGNHKAPDEYQEVGKSYNIKPNAKFEKQQTSTQLPLDPLDSMEYRLKSGRNIIRHRMIQQRIANETGLSATVGGKTIRQNPAKIADHVFNLPAADTILQSAHSSSVKGYEWLRHVANVGRDTLIGGNPLPHMKNIGFMGYLGQGIPVAAKGLYYALKGVPKDITDALEHHGAATHFALSDPEKYSFVRLNPARKKFAQILDRFDTGMRAAAYEKIKHANPHLTPYELAEKVNEDIGAYQDSPQYVEYARGFLGAQFPQWHSYIVPTAVGRAALRYPQRVESVVRATNDVNDDVIGKNAGYEINPGGPVSEAANLYADPLRVANLPYQEAPKALLSPSAAGPFVGGLAHLTNKAGEGTSILDPEDLAGQVLPYWNIVGPQLGFNQFNSKAPANIRSVAAIIGAYPKAQQSLREAMIRNYMQQGMSRFKAEQQVQRALSALRRYK